MENETAAQEATSTQKKLLSCHDPGWNDPPKWAFSPGQKTGDTPTKRLLNKRVAFPLSSGSPALTTNTDRLAAGISIPGNLPPRAETVALTSAPHAPLLAPTPITHNAHSSLGIDKKQALSETMDNFETVLNGKLGSNSKKEEVRRRLDAMKIMWEDDKLKDAVHEKVLRISKALRNNDVDGADKIHISLMMDEAALCNTWISGIRHIILELRDELDKTRKEGILSTEQNVNPYLLPQSVNKCENT